jgi:hypothetical protein
MRKTKVRPARKMRRTPPTGTNSKRKLAEKMNAEARQISVALSLRLARHHQQRDVDTFSLMPGNNAWQST